MSHSLVVNDFYFLAPRVDRRGILFQLFKVDNRHPIDIDIRLVGNLVSSLRASTSNLVLADVLVLDL